MGSKAWFLKEKYSYTAEFGLYLMYNTRHGSAFLYITYKLVEKGDSAMYNSGFASLECANKPPV